MRGKKGSIPTKQHHRGSGQLRVRIEGKDHYCGVWGTEEAEEKADRLIARWIEGRRGGTITSPRRADPDRLVGELLVGYDDWSGVNHLDRSGKKTAERYHVAAVIRVLRGWASVPIEEFNPGELKAVRESMVRLGWSRRHVNDQVQRVRRVFRWGVEHGYVPVAVLHALREVAPLRRGRTEAPETVKKLPVESGAFEKTVRRLPKVLEALARFQRLTGMRPGEVVRLKVRDIVKAPPGGDGCWLIDFGENHKTAWAGKEKRVWVGPKAQAVIKRLLKGKKPGDYVFPSKVIHGRQRCYRVDSYQHAVKEACRAAGVEEWSPNQLRHSRLTEVGMEAGPMDAQAVGGHSTMNTTAIYLHLQDELAKKAARKSG